MRAPRFLIKGFDKLFPKDDEKESMEGEVDEPRLVPAQTVRPVKMIVVHCSASEFGSATLIDSWHKERGWNGIGYHYVILNGYRYAAKFLDEDDGRVEMGRPEAAIGAHAKGFNEDSLGICLIGLRKFTMKQLLSAGSLISHLAKSYGVPLRKIVGHRELTTKKTCPNIDPELLREFLWKQYGLRG